VTLLANRIALGVALGAALIVAAHDLAAAQSAPNGQPPSLRGVKHVLYLSVKSEDPDLQRADGADAQKNEPAKETPKAALKVTVRISDHALETSFFGNVSATAADFDPAKGSPEQEIWRDARCHHERSLPKMSVVAVDGLIARGPDKQIVETRPRHIGLPIPWDEVLMASGIQFGADDRGSFLETRTRTSESHLSVALKMYILPCDVE
jgi:hypothetical protein